MKIYTLILLIIVTAVLQVSMFYSFPSNLNLDLVLILGWFVFLRGEKNEAVYLVFFTGVLIDIFCLGGVGVTSFAILLPFAILNLIEEIAHVKNPIISNVLMVFLVCLTFFIKFFIGYILNRGVVFDSSVLFFLVLSGILNSFIVILMGLLFVGRKNTDMVSFSKNK